MHKQVKDVLKSALPPTTRMLDRRVELLLSENRALSNRVEQLSGELSAVKNVLTSLRADGLRGRMKSEALSPLVGSPGVIVSVASYGPRISHIAPMLVSLGQQSVRPDRAFLWLPLRDFPKGVDDLPADVVCALYDARVEPRFVEDDLGPHNKYFWTMQAFPESIVITLDDDVRYPNDLIERLMKKHRVWKSEIVAMRARVILSEGEGLCPYEAWPLELGPLLGSPSFSVIGTGVGGVLYPPHCLDEHVFDSDGIRSTCLRADDLWLKVMSVIAGTKVVCPVPDCPLDYIPGTQEMALCDNNLYQGGNDTQLTAILEYVSLFADEEDILRKMQGDARGFPRCEDAT